MWLLPIAEGRQRLGLVSQKPAAAAAGLVVNATAARALLQVFPLSNGVHG